VETTRQLRASIVLVAMLMMLTVLVGIGFDPLIDLDHVVARHAYDSTIGHQNHIVFWERVTTWGGPQVMRIAILVGAVVLAVARQWVLAAWLAVLAILEALVAPSAKLVLERPRPHWADPITTVSSTSFPSGHATAAMTAAVAALLLARRFGRGRLSRNVLPTGALAAAVAVAASRVFLGVHYLSDVLGGALLGAALAVSTYAVAQWFSLLRPAPGRR
jgi:membrane-associated phospholipid phosphatase